MGGLEFTQQSRRVIPKQAPKMTIAVAAMAAVSARRIVLPSEAEDPTGLLKRLQLIVSPAALGADGKSTRVR